MAPPPPPDDGLAARLRGFGPIGVLAMVAILAGNLILVPLSALLAIAWAWRSHTPWHDIGFVRPSSWPRTIAIGIVCGAVFKLLMKSVVMPLLGAPPINQAYQHLVGNTAAIPAMLYVVIVGAGFGEEVLFRGYLFERLRRRLGRATWAEWTTVAITTALFGLAHGPGQGLPGVQQATIVGFAFGATYAFRGGLPLLMITHAAFDVTALALIYWGQEAAVAGWFFR